MIKTDTRGYAWLDYGRFLAALSVMLFHYVALGISNGSITAISPVPYLSQAMAYGYLGVDFFFMISGFVITISAEQKRAQDFAVSRFVRLWPTFLICMTLSFVVLGASDLSDTRINAMNYIVNLTMLPRHLGFEPIDDVYWTLAFEIMFYALVFTIIAIGKFCHFEKIVKAWVVGIIVCRLLDINIIVFSYYFALFAAGCLFSIIGTKGFTWWRFAFLVATFVFSTATAIEHGGDRTFKGLFELSPVVISAIYTVFFGAFAFFTAFPSTNVQLPFSRIVGLVTYPLYLLHNEIGIVILNQLGRYLSDGLNLLLTSVGMILLSVAVVQLWEKPLKRYWVTGAHKILDAILPRPLKRGLLSADKT